MVNRQVNGDVIVRRETDGARRRYCQALTEKIGEGPGEEEHYHLFSVDIESTAFGIIEDGERWVRRI